MKKRIITTVMCLCMALTLLPSAAFAADGKAIQLVDSVNNPTGGIRGYNSASSAYNYVYYGTNGGAPIKWRVLDDKTNYDSDNDGTNEVGLFLLSEGLFGTGYYGDVYFDNDAIPNPGQTNPNEWQHSDAQDWCKTFETGSLTPLELGAIVATRKDDAAYNSIDTTYNSVFTASFGILNGDKVFFLSAEEAENTEYGFTSNNSRLVNYNGHECPWWLRSPRTYINSSAGVVYMRGKVNDYEVNKNWAARPAFNMDMSKILFAAAADNSGQNATFTSPAAYSGLQWKLTVKDANSFAAGASKTGGNTELTAGYAAQTLSFSHAALSSLSADYTNVTAALTNAAGELLYYGSVNTDTAATISEVVIPSGLTEGSYTLSLYGEDRNAANTTDYATGTPYTQTITVAAATVYPVTKGENGTWAKGSGAGLSVTSSGEYSKFTGVDVDGSFLSEDKFTAESGSTVVTLKAEYLETLTAGIHTLKIHFTDGYSQTSFTVGTKSPQTGDASAAFIWIGVLCTACAGAAILIARKRRSCGR